MIQSPKHFSYIFWFSSENTTSIFVFFIGLDGSWFFYWESFARCGPMHGYSRESIRCCSCKAMQAKCSHELGARSWSAGRRLSIGQVALNPIEAIDQLSSRTRDTMFATLHQMSTPNLCPRSVSLVSLPSLTVVFWSSTDLLLFRRWPTRSSSSSRLWLHLTSPKPYHGTRRL